MTEKPAPKDLGQILATVRYHLNVTPNGPCTRCGAEFPWPIGQVCPKHPEVLVEKMLSILVWYIDGLTTESEMLHTLSKLPQSTLNRLPKYRAPNAPTPLYVKLEKWQASIEAGAEVISAGSGKDVS